MSEDERLVLVDASVFITLAEVDAVEYLNGLRGSVAVPAAVEREVTDEPAATELQRWIDRDDLRVLPTVRWLQDRDAVDGLADAASRLGHDLPDDPQDVADVRPDDVDLLAVGHVAEDAVVVTDDRPLRAACKSLAIPVSGSIGVLVRAVERGDLEPETAKATLYAIDEVGARLSASLVRRAERLIDEAGG